MKTISTIKVKCEYCGKEFTARIADRQRGWARFCSKQCKAKKQAQKHPKQYRLKSLRMHDDDGTIGCLPYDDDLNYEEWQTHLSECGDK
jgi:uncharacterized Zn-finger protein